MELNYRMAFTECALLPTFHMHTDMKLTPSVILHSDLAYDTNVREIF